MKHNLFKRLLSVFLVAVMVLSVLPAKQAEAATDSATETIRALSSKEQQSSYGFFLWLSKQTVYDVDDSVRTDAEYAVQLLKGEADQSSSLFSSSFSASAVVEVTYEEAVDYTEIGGSGDATEFSLFLKALNYIKIGNENYRALESLDALKVSSALMAMGELNSNAMAEKNELGHTLLFNAYENCAYAMKSSESSMDSYDPYEGWYTKEKAYYDEDSSTTKAGHYKTLTDRNGTMYITGFGCGIYQLNSYYYCFCSQQFSNSSFYYAVTDDNAISVDDYITYANYYYDNVIATPATGITISQTTAAIDVNGTLSLTASVQPLNDDSVNRNVTWSTSDENVATVSSDGKVTGISNGEATITVTSEDGGFTAECVVTVGYKATMLIDGSSFNLAIKELVGTTATSYDTQDKNMSYFVHADSLDESYEKSRIKISTDDSTVPCYAWFDSSSKTVYWYSEADVVYFNTDATGMFANFSYLNDVDFSDFNTSKTTTFADFMCCNNMNYKMNIIDVSTFDFSNATDISSMFSGVGYKAQYIYLGEFNISNVTGMQYLFNYDKGVKRIFVNSDPDLSGLGSNVSYGSWYMFSNCTNLVGGNGTEYDSSNINYAYAKIDTLSQTGYFTNGIYGPNITDISFDNTEESIYLGDTLAITPTVTPTDYFSNNVEWSVSDASVLSLEMNDDGTVGVTGLKEGEATITISSVNDKIVSATCKITVKIKTYSVNFASNGGEGTMEAQSFQYGVSGNLSENKFERTGYTFAGWSTDSSATTPEYEDGAEVSNLTDVDGGVVTLYAVWTAHKYNVAFYPNGADGLSYEQEFTYGVEQQLTENTFTYEGYTFSGWALTGDDSVKYSDKATVSNLTAVDGGTFKLYAVWKANQYSVAFNANGGEGSMDEQSFVYDASQNLKENAFTKKGYTFSGWGLASDAAVKYTDGELVSNLTTVADDTVTLYAVWSANSYQIAFNNNGGSGEMEPLSVSYDEKVNLTDNIFTNDGYTFIGWAKSTDAKAVAYTNGQEVSNLAENEGATVTLYAIWSPNAYTVHFEAGEGTGSMSDQTFTYGQSQNLTANGFTKEGYSFAGWTDQDNNKYQDGVPVVNLTSEANGTVTLTASWEANTYTVKFDINGGDEGSMTDQTMTYDESASLNTNQFTKTGYSLAGWALTAEATEAKYKDEESVSNLTAEANGTVKLYAVWEPNTYYVMLHSNDGTDGRRMISFIYDEESNLPENTFTREDYRFLGWSLSADSTEVKYEDKATIKNVATSGTFHLYAVWAKLYTITYEANKGSTTPDAQQGIMEENVTLASAITKDSLSNDEKVTYTVSFDSDGGSEVSSVKATKTTTKTTNYTFNGWQETTDDSTGKTYEAGATYTITSDVTMKAQWTSSETTTSSTTSVTLPTVTKTGYTFKGWYNGSTKAGDAGDSYTPTSSVTLTAKWEAIKVTSVTLNKSTLNLEEGKTSTLTATVSPTDALNTSVTWTSSNESVATVGSDGKVKAVSVGTATITATANDGSNCSATCTVTVTRPISTATASVDDQTYTGSAITPEVTLTDGGKTLTKGTDYTITSYANNTNVGTATITITGKGNYSGTRTVNFNIVKKKVAIPTATNYTYDGSEKTGVKTSSDYNFSEGGKWKATNAGTYTVKVSLESTKNTTWSDGSTETKTLTWTISPKSIANAIISSVSDQTYTGLSLVPTVTVKDGDTKKALTKDTDYTVAYSNNVDAGTATITITGKGNYTGTRTVNFTINKAKIEKPTGTDYEYDMSEKTGVEEGTGYTLSGTYKAYNPGTYTAKATLDDNHLWSDGTSGVLTITWKITKTEESSESSDDSGDDSGDESSTPADDSSDSSDESSDESSSKTGDDSSKTGDDSSKTSEDSSGTKQEDSGESSDSRQEDSGESSDSKKGDDSDSKKDDSDSKTDDSSDTKKEDSDSKSEDSSTEIKEVDMDLNDVTVGAGLQIEMNPGFSSDDVTWKSSSTKYATVDENGIVTGVKVVPGEGSKVGSVTITATSDDGETKSADVTVLFADVMDSSSYFYNPVYWAYNNGITTGRRGGLNFDPWATCTRAEIVTFLWRHAGKPSPSKALLDDNPFGDITSDKYYYKAVLWAYENNITTGRRGTNADGTVNFDPNATCTRREIVTFLWRYAGKPAPDTATSPFADVTVDAKGNKPYYYDAVLWAVDNKVTTGKSQRDANGNRRFDPLGECTRGMSVTFIYRYDKLN